MKFDYLPRFFKSARRQTASANPRAAVRREQAVRSVLEQLESRVFLSTVLPGPMQTFGAAPQQGSTVIISEVAVTTDRLDYAPGETVYISGSGFKPNETVTLQILHIDGTPNTEPHHLPWTVTANLNGKFKSTWLVGEDDLNTTMRLTADGNTSGRHAEEIFTDSVSVTAATGGTNLSADKAANATSPQYTTLGTISIDEPGSDKQAFGVNQTNKTLILTAPSGWTFNPGVGTVSFTSNKDITAASISVAASTITVTITTGSGSNTDGLDIVGIQVRATSGSSIPSSGQIYRSTGNPGTLPAISGITTTSNTSGSGGTNFGSLSQVAGAASKLAFTTSGQTIAAGGITGTMTVQLTDQFGTSVNAGGAGQTVNLASTSGTGVFRNTADSATITSVTIPSGSGTASFRYRDTSTGSPTITVSGAGLTSITQGVTVTANATTTTVANAPTTTVFGQAVALTATVGGGPTPTGTVTFLDGVTSLGTGTLDGSGQASLNVSSLSVGTHSITASYGGDAAHSTSVSTAVTQTVNKAASAATVTSNLNPITYGQTTSFKTTVAAVSPGAGTVSGTVQFQIDGVNFGSAVTLANVSGVMTATSGSIATLTAGNHVVTGIYSGDGNFNTNTGTLSGGETVNKATLTVTTDPQTRIYGDANPTFTGTISGIQNSDNITATYASAATVTSNVGSYAITATLSDPGSKLSNYNVTNAGGTLTVTKSALTVTANNASRAYGAANPSFTATITGFKNSDTQASSTTGAANLTTTATATSVVGSYTITAALGTLASSNYSFGFANGSLSVTPAALSVTANSTSRVYGNANPSFSGTITGIQNSDNITATYASAATAASNVGSYAINATLVDPNSKLSNYTVTNTAGSLTVTAAPLSVTPANASRLWAANPSFSGTITGIQNSDNITATYATAATAASNVGSYNITASLVDPGSKLGNYTVTSNTGTLSVTAASLSVTTDPQTRIYGDANPTFTGTISGIQNSDNITATYSSVATPTSSVGSYAITATLSDPGSKLGNYNVTNTGGTLTVNKAGLTVTADNTSRVYGAANPSFTATITGFKNGENLGSSGVTGSPSLATTATTNTNVGTAAITAAAGSLASGNYSFGFAPGVLTITPAALSVTANNASRLYGAANPSFSGTLTGVVAGDNITASYSSPATASSGVGSYAINATLNDPSSRLGNYTVANTSGALSVTPVSLLVSANHASRVYGAANPSLTATFSGFANGETLGTSDVTGTAGLSTSATSASDVGSYAITAAAGSLASTNYTFTFANNTLDVTQAGLSLTVDNASRTYGAANPSFTGTLSGVVNGDNITASYSTLADPSSDVGTYTITGTLSDPDSRLGNYTVSNTSGTLTVDAAELSVTVDDASREYGDANPTFTGAVSGLVNGDSITASYSSTATASSDVGTYAITASLNDPNNKLGNYNVTNTPGVLTIDAATLTVSANSDSRIYGDANPAFSGSVTGIKNGDDITATFNSAATAASNVGTYAITSSLSDPDSKLTNYTLVSNDGVLTIDKATLTVTADNATRPQGDANPAFTASYLGFKNGQNLGSSGVSGSPALSTLADSSSAPGGYVITAAQGSLAAANYDFTFANGTLTVTAARPAVTSFVVNNGASQRSMVKTLTVSFANAVTLDPGALSLSVHNGGPVPATLNAVLSGDRKSVTITFSGTGVIGGSIGDGVFDLVLHGGLVHNDDGYAMTGDVTSVFHRLYGDLDGDRSVTTADYTIFNTSYGKRSTDAAYISGADYNADGIVNNTDLFQFKARQGTSI